MRDIEYLKKYLETDKLENGIERLKNGEPVQYIVGNVDFFDLNLDVNKNVLIPRFETEELVEKTLNYIQKYFHYPIRILDMGTGSGCIALTLKKKLENCEVDASDISDKALEVARQNAKKNNLDITFINSDIFDNINNKYDCLISNPPYIAYDEKIMEIVKNNEPNNALYAKNNGLYFYEEILKNATNYLNEKNLIAFEIGESQGQKIKDLALYYFPNSKVIVKNDLQGRNRFIFIFNNLDIKNNNEKF